jgi:hypothetical protein
MTAARRDLRAGAGAIACLAVLCAMACGKDGAAPPNASGQLDDGGTNPSGDGALSTSDAPSDAPAADSGPPQDAAQDAAGPPRTFKVYVSGASVEMRNRWVAVPFTGAGARDDHGQSPNRADEFGWMVPLADRLKLRDPGITLEWVGTFDWSGVDDATYSGTYPTSSAPKTSALSGSDISSWLSSTGNDDLQNKRYCYDVAIAARGGNEFSNADDASFKTQYKGLIRLLGAGSSCRARPLILVVARLPDLRPNGMNDVDYVNAQTQRYKTRVEETVNELKASDPGLALRFVDAFTKFRNNAATTAFPSPAWWLGTNFDFALMHRDGKHPLRLASIYFGEVVADGVDIPELRALP